MLCHGTHTRVLACGRRRRRRVREGATNSRRVRFRTNTHGGDGGGADVYKYNIICVPRLSPASMGLCAVRCVYVCIFNYVYTNTHSIYSQVKSILSEQGDVAYAENLHALLARSPQVHAHAGHGPVPRWNHVGTLGWDGVAALAWVRWAATAAASVRECKEVFCVSVCAHVTRGETDIYFKVSAQVACVHSRPENPARTHTNMRIFSPLG